MKKMYNTPEFEAISILTKDIVTLSDGENGNIKTFGFEDILGEQGGWTKVN